MSLKGTFFKVSGLFVVMLLTGSMAFGQLIGSDAYMIGDHVEIGVNGNGGHEGAAELPGSNNRSNLAITSPVYFGFVANPQLDSWAQYDGDFFSPGTPENGFGMEIAGVNYGNNATGGPLNEIAGGLVGYETEDDCITIEWEGSAGGVTINVKYHLLATNLFYTTEITMTNDTDVDLTDVYYYRNVDPDNNVTIGGGYPTTNTIVSQPDSSCQKALVSATQPRPAGAGPGTSYVGFGALGDNFRVARGGFSNRDASDIWNGAGGLIGTVGSAALADQAIALAYKSDIAAGESINFTFAVVLSDAALEDAFQGLYYINFESFGLSGGGVVSACNPTVDTAQTCGGNPVFLTVEGPNVDDFSWVWSPGDGLTTTTGTSTEATPISTTTYTATGTPLGGCLTEPVSKIIVVEYLDGPQINITYPDSAVCGAFDLTTLIYEDINAVPGTVSYFFSEVPDSATQTSPLWPSDFMVEGDSVYLMIADPLNGCFDYELVEIDFADPVYAGADSSAAYCQGSPVVLDMNTLVSGDAGGVWTELTPSGAFDAGTGNLTISAMAAGTYEYSYVVGGAPCPEDDAIFTITIYPAPVVEIAAMDDLCGEGGASATAEVAGGSEPYTYAWDSGETSPSISISETGVYSVTVVDANGCSATDSAEVVVNDSLGVVMTGIDAICGGEEAAATASPYGGTAPYTYEWSTGATTSYVIGLETGTYTVTVTDANGCTTVGAVDVFSADALELTIESTDALCGGDEGTATAVVAGGTAPYSYAWSTGETTASISGSAAGTYSVTVTDTNGCSASASVTIMASEPIAVEVTSTGALCGGAEGTATATVIGGTAPYSYSWSTGETTATITGLVSGSYTVTVTDTNGCAATGTVEVLASEPIAIEVTTTDAICGEDNGSASVDVIGGTAPYSYTWSTGETGVEIDGLAPGVYIVTVTDSVGCTATDSLVIEGSDAVVVEVTGTGTTCGEDNGSATAVVSGGTAPYTYAWSNGETTASISDLPAGDYTVVVTDANGCESEATVTIEDSENTLYVEKWTINHVTCHGGDNGSVYVFVGGGVPPYTYEWSTGETTLGIEDLTAGTYEVTITDAEGCSITETVEITEPDPIDVTVSLVDGCFISNESGASYQWVVCPDYEELEGETDQSYCPYYCSEREFAVIITTEDGCVDTSACVGLDDEGLSVGDNEMLTISIYPNPTNGEVFIRLDGMNQDIQLNVVDANGRIVYQKQVIDSIEAIDMSGAANGIYFVQLRTADQVITRKITVSK